MNNFDFNAPKVIIADVEATVRRIRKETAEISNKGAADIKKTVAGLERIQKTL